MSRAVIIPRRGLAVFALIAIVGTLSANVRRVPQDYGSIQAALNSVVNDDTVLIALGTYAEELMASPLRFWLIGDVPIDTGNFARPVLDPSTLDSARWRSSLQIPDGAEVAIERLSFVNGPTMYPRDDPWGTGGIMDLSLLPLTVRYCTFDSVYRAITDKDQEDTLQVRIIVEDCRFADARSSQICPRWYRHIEVRRSSFAGGHFWSHFIYVGDSSVIEECTFSGDSIEGAAVIEGEDAIVRNCVFGPMDTLTNSVLTCGSQDGIVIGNSVFQNLGMRAGMINTSWESGTPITIRHNVFADNHVWSGSSPGIHIDQSGLSPAGFAAMVDSNTFAFLDQGQSSAAKAVMFGTRVSFTGNRFAGLHPQGVHTLDKDGAIEGCVLRYNQFERDDYALDNGNYQTDARYNYWGDPTGPYNASYHPEGSGARIDGEVLYDPWSPDTNFLAVSEPHVPLPQFVTLNVFPNPFNASTVIQLTVDAPGVFRVDLFNLLGQHVRDVWSGAVVNERLITFDADHLASGIYFVRVWQPIGNRPLALQKIVLLK